jgi:hypothetical protein
MSEIWLVVEIYPIGHMGHLIDMILSFIKPTLGNLEKEQTLETFHFLFEPGHLLFRARTLDEEKRQQAKSIVDKNLDSIKEAIDRIEFIEDYTGEHDQFGIEGWQHVQKLLEYSSRISILKWETLTRQKPLEVCRLDRGFNEKKLVHCFLNAQGFSIPEEVIFHNEANVERLLLANSYFGIHQRLQALEKKIVSDQLKS